MDTPVSATPPSSLSPAATKEEKKDARNGEQLTPLLAAWWDLFFFRGSFFFAKGEIREWQERTRSSRLYEGESTKANEKASLFKKKTRTRYFLV